MRLEPRTTAQVAEFLQCAPSTLFKVRAHKNRRLENSLAFLGLVALEWLNEDDLEDLLKFYTIAELNSTKGRPVGWRKNKK